MSVAVTLAGFPDSTTNAYEREFKVTILLLAVSRHELYVSSPSCFSNYVINTVWLVNGR